MDIMLNYKDKQKMKYLFVVAHPDDEMLVDVEMVAVDSLEAGRLCGKLH